MRGRKIKKYDEFANFVAVTRLVLDTFRCVSLRNQAIPVELAPSFSRYLTDTACIEIIVERTLEQRKYVVAAKA